MSKANGHAADKLIGEWFWTDRWVGSSAFLMPIEARGLYREMLTAAWRRGAQLPNDPEKIRRAVGATVEEWRRQWPRVRKYWRAVDNKRFLINDTQREIYAETKARTLAASNRGAAGARARWGKHA